MLHLHGQSALADDVTGKTLEHLEDVELCGALHLLIDKAHLVPILGYISQYH